MTPGRLLRLLRAGWVMACGLAVVGYSLSFAGLFQEGGWEVLKVWQPWLLLSLGIAGLAVIRLSLRRAEVQLAPLVPRRVSAPTSPRQTAAYTIAPDPGVATVAVVIHGVGDHSGGDMLARAETGLAAFAGAPFACQHPGIEASRRVGRWRMCLEGGKRWPHAFCVAGDVERAEAAQCAGHHARWQYG